MAATRLPWKKHSTVVAVEAHVDLLPHQPVRDAVVVAVDVDVVVDVDDRRLPLGEFVARGRQRLHRRPVDGLEDARREPWSFLNGRVLRSTSNVADGGVELFEAEELAIAQPRQNPALGQEHARLDGRFVTRIIWPRRENGGPVVTRQIAVGRVGLGLVATGFA